MPVAHALAVVLGKVIQVDRMAWVALCEVLELIELKMEIPLRMLQIAHCHNHFLVGGADLYGAVGRLASHLFLVEEVFDAVDFFLRQLVAHAAALAGYADVTGA